MAEAGYQRRPPAGAGGWRGRVRRHAPGPGGGRFRHVYGALDLGTNNCRLLVARPTRGGFRVIDAFSRIVRLGEGMGESGTISPAAMDRTIEALAICAQKMRRRAVTRARHVATEACRRAVNCADFLERVARETGIEIEIIDTAEEARLAVAGCRPLIVDEARHALVFDIGGGSTELVWFDRDGAQGEKVGEPELIFNQAFSPDETRASPHGRRPGTHLIHIDEHQTIVDDQPIRTRLDEGARPGPPPGRGRNGLPGHVQDPQAAHPGLRARATAQRA